MCYDTDLSTQRPFHRALLKKYNIGHFLRPSLLWFGEWINFVDKRGLV